MVRNRISNAQFTFLSGFDSYNLEAQLVSLSYKTDLFNDFISSVILVIPNNLFLRKVFARLLS